MSSCHVKSQAPLIVELRCDCYFALTVTRISAYGQQSTHPSMGYCVAVMTGSFGGGVAGAVYLPHDVTVPIVSPPPSIPFTCQWPPHAAGAARDFSDV